MGKTLSELEEDNKYQKKVLEELQQENRELRDKLYKYWLKYGPIETESSYVSYEITYYPNDGLG